MLSNDSNKWIRVTLKKSLIGRLGRHRACVRGLGLRRIHQSVVVKDTLCTRGVIRKVEYLVECEEL